MDENKNIKHIETQIGEVKDKIWEIEKKLNFPTDELYLYKKLKSIEEKINNLQTIHEERINVLETLLKVGDYQDE